MASAPVPCTLIDCFCRLAILGAGLPVAGAERNAGDVLKMNLSLLSLPLVAAAAAPSTAGAAAAPGAGPSILSFVPLILIALIFYLLVLRPQQQKAKEHRELISRLKVGDRVVTSAGMYGEVVGVDDTTLMVKVANGVEIRFVRSAVTTVLSADQDASEKPAEKAPAKTPDRAAKKR